MMGLWVLDLGGRFYLEIQKSYEEKRGVWEPKKGGGALDCVLSLWLYFKGFRSIKEEDTFMG